MTESLSWEIGQRCGRVWASGAVDGRPFPLPGDRPHYARDRTIDIRHIKLEITLDLEGKRVSGEVHITLAPINDGLTHVEFDAVEMDIDAVRMRSGEPLAFDHSDGRLRLDLGGARRAGEDLTIVVEYSAGPRRGLYFIAPDEGYPDKPVQAWSQGEDEDSRHWFPCYDFPNEMATSEVVVTVAEPYTVISNGELMAVTRGPDGRTHTYHWYQSVPHVAYLISVVAGEFAQITERLDGLPVQYFVPKGREEDGRRVLGNTPDMIRFFSERIGIPYPYAKYAQVTVADFIFGGMENISATTLTDTILHDERAHLDYSADSLVAHELAHQWFGDLLTCRDWAHAWLNEGFATYLEALYKEHHEGIDEFRYHLCQEAQTYFREDARRYRRPIVTNVYREPIDLFDRQSYEKGGWVLHMMRFVLGEELFWKAVRHYAAKHCGTNVTTPDLQRAVEEATGRNLDWFFDQWVFKAGHPQFKVAYEWDDAAGQARLTVNQTQETDGQTPLFRMPVNIAFATGDGNQTFRVQLSEKEQSFYFPLPEKPKMVRFDPGSWLLKTLEFKRPKELLLHQLQHDDDVMGRIDAAKGLAKLGTPEAVGALKTAVLQDPFWGVQAEAAKALGEMKSKAAMHALIECLGVEHPKARRGVVAALGDFRDEPPAHRGGAAAGALERVLSEGDASYYVEAEAARSLGKTKSSRALDALVKALEKDSHNEVIRVRAFEGMAELKEERAIPVAVEWTAYGKPSQARQAAASALGTLGEVASPGQREQVLDRLVELLGDPDLRVRLSAVAALQELKDDKAVPHLERLAERDLDGRVVRRAREAAARIREGKDKGEEVRKLRTDLDKLAEENRELRDRLARLEARLDAAGRSTEEAM